MRPLLFLDVDGVLNSEEAFIGATTTKVIDPKCVAQLRRIIEACDPEIVLSSTWRHYPDHAQVIYDLIGHVLPHTPSVRMSSARGEEIDSYMEDFPERVYVILDDDRDMLPKQRRYHVNTDPRVGLTEADADRAIALLQRKAKARIDNKRKTR